MTWLLTVEFWDQLPNYLLSQRGRLPGMQKMGKIYIYIYIFFFKKKKEMAKGHIPQKPAKGCDSGGKGTQDRSWDCRGQPECEMFQRLLL